MAASARDPGFADVHAALLRDGALQFDLPAAAAPPPAPSMPAQPFHLPSGFGVDAVWILAALAAMLVVGLAAAHLRGRPAAPDVPRPLPATDPFPIAPAAAQSALGDADRLAAQGRHLDAARALLACGLDAIARTHPGLLRPTTTSRDIAAEPALPGPLRSGFARIARAVEVGLFGGRPVGPGDYAACRKAFLESAFGGGA